MLAADLALLADLDAQIAAAEAELARLLPLSPFAHADHRARAGARSAPATTAPRWATRPAGPGHRQVYRAAGLSPIQYESAGKRRDGAISREGSVELRRALIDLGIGLWLNDPAAKAYAAGLRARGKKGGVIACAHGPPRQPDRLRPGPRPGRLRPDPLEPEED